MNMLKPVKNHIRFIFGHCAFNTNKSKTMLYVTKDTEHTQEQLNKIFKDDLYVGQVTKTGNYTFKCVLLNML